LNNLSQLFIEYLITDIFSDLKNLEIRKETKIYRHSCKRRVKISITAKFHGAISQNGEVTAMQSSHNNDISDLRFPFEMGKFSSCQYDNIENEQTLSGHK
jgi:hypothetical protein